MLYPLAVVGLIAGILTLCLAFFPGNSLREVFPFAGTILVISFGLIFVQMILSAAAFAAKNAVKAALGASLEASADNKAARKNNAPAGDYTI